MLWVLVLQFNVGGLIWVSLRIGVSTRYVDQQYLGPFFDLGSQSGTHVPHEVAPILMTVLTASNGGVPAEVLSVPIRFICLATSRDR